MILADAVQAAENKLFVLGGGWRFTGPDVGPMGVGVIVEVAWHEANEPHRFRLELQTADAVPARIGLDGQTLRVEGEIEVGRPPGHPRGTPFNVPLAVNLGPLPLDPGTRYVWALFLDGSDTPSSTVGFDTRPRQA